ncbi:hypothetical protein TNCV_4410491 [Trichonephila clavipes]|nr:hypothetical protein TNCV_4410491 [Trichonephila clavipes]
MCEDACVRTCQPDYIWSEKLIDLPFDICQYFSAANRVPTLAVPCLLDNTLTFFPPKPYGRIILALTLVRARRVMEYLETIDYISKKDHGPNSTEKSTPKKPKLNQAEHDKGMLQARLKYVRSLLQIEIDSPGPTPDVRLALETELEEVESQMKVLEGKMTELLPRPIALNPQTKKSKRVKRSAAPVEKPAKSTKPENTNDSDFVFPKKTIKKSPCNCKE